MGRQRKQEKALTPKSYFLAQAIVDSGDKQMIIQTGFESLVFEELQKARGYTNERLKKFPTDENRFFSLEDLDVECTVKIVHRGFDPGDMFKTPDKLRKLYDAESADTVVLNDFKYRDSLGVSLAALGVIQYEDMLGVITTIPNSDCSPIYVGLTTDIFETLVLAGLIPKWHPAQEGDE